MFHVIVKAFRSDLTWIENDLVVYPLLKYYAVLPRRNVNDIKVA